MSVSSFTPKGCSLDLSLAGSRVAIVHAFKYSSGRPSFSTVNNGQNNISLKGHQRLGSGTSASDFQLCLTANEITLPPSAKLSRTASSKRLRFQQLPPFGSGTEHWPQRPCIVPSDNATIIAGEISDQLTLSRNHKYSTDYLPKGNEKHAQSQSLDEKTVTQATERDILHPHYSDTAAQEYGNQCQNTQNESSCSSVSNHCASKSRYGTPNSGDAPMEGDGQDNDTCKCLLTDGKNQTIQVSADSGTENGSSQMSLPPSSSSTAETKTFGRRKEKKKKKNTVKASKTRPGSYKQRSLHKASHSNVNHVPNEEEKFQGTKSVLNELQAFCKPIQVMVSPPKTSKPKKLRSGNGVTLIAPKSLTDLRQLVSRSQQKSQVPDSTSDHTALTSTLVTRTTPHKIKEASTSRSVHAWRKQEEVVRMTKVYLSDRQSGVLKELGLEFPCAPPATPAPQLQQQYEYIPSLCDIRSQRALRVQLEAMYKAEKRKQEQEKENRMKQEKINLKEREKEQRKRQRLEIYALNKVMTQLEHNNFKEFCKLNGVECKI